eukprot:TRINITY_DN18198_c0_g1_i4.p1 TRINITY_DN18198_c0_g1~~TRINITY_DN18198_c0_g1_i4.p1  ORF type:complete len:372 (-),score=58.46 TRINITY_DN18198_c0_g1_i4:37-1152(-)
MLVWCAVLWIAGVEAQEYYGPVYTPDPSTLGQPEQVHLMLGGGPGSYVVNWHSTNVSLGQSRYQSTWSWDSSPPPEIAQMQSNKQLGPFISMVRYGYDPAHLLFNATAAPAMWVDQRCGTVRLRHSVPLSNLSSGRTVFYSVQAISGLQPETLGYASDLFHFSVPASIHATPLVAAVVVDMGSGSALVRNNDYSDNRTYPDCIAQLLTDSAARKHQLVIHPGDIAYSLDDDCGRVGDFYHNILQPLSAQVPYMLSPGNHEWSRGQTWSAFDDRYAGQRWVSGASGSGSTRYYSFEQGMVHWVMLDSNPWVYSGIQGEVSLVAPQYRWLQQDLASVDRSRTPWVVVLGHHSCLLYTSPSPRDRTRSRMPSSA